MLVSFKVCKFCTPVLRALSSFQVRNEFPLFGKTNSRIVNFNEKRLFSPSINFFRHQNNFYYVKRKYHISCATSLPYPTTKELVEHDNMKIIYKRVLESFPDGIQMAFAYGSGAVVQGTNNDMSKNMLDFIFVVDNPEQWHQLNLKRNPSHYSFLKFAGPRGVAKVQERYGAGVYFNTLVPMHGRIIKYGVVSTDTVTTDLLDWDSLYISGRLHKPINLIVVPKDDQLLEALIVNLKSAVHTALLLLPDVFTEQMLYTTIAGLSYSGDIRMSVAEDNNKVNNIVKPNIWSFRRMYLPILNRFQHVMFWHEIGQLEQALTFESRHYHLTQLPCQVLHGLVLQKQQIGVNKDLEEIIHINAFDTACGENVSRCLKKIVKKSSLNQTLKGVLTAGVKKSILYGFSKVMKKIKSS